MFKVLYFVSAFLIFEVASCTECLQLVPSSYPCCDNAGPLPDLGSGLVSNAPVYSPLTSSPKTDLFSSGLQMPTPTVADDDTSAGYKTKAYSCSLIPCLEEEASAVCACNFNTGNVVTFKNSCDVKKHNCRFDTGKDLPWSLSIEGYIMFVAWSRQNLIFDYSFFLL